MRDLTARLINRAACPNSCTGCPRPSHSGGAAVAPVGQVDHKDGVEAGGSNRVGISGSRSIARGRWEATLAEDRCASAKAKAARLWLYENNMTYRQFYDLHRSILRNFKAGNRDSLYEKTSVLLADKSMRGLEVAAWPILYPWSRYGDTDGRARLFDNRSGKKKNPCCSSLGIKI